MSDRVLVVLAGIGTLVLTREAYDAALHPVAATELDPAPAALEPVTGLVTAQVLARQLSLPKSCVYEYAKAGRIPCVRAGKHVRFNPAQVLAVLSASGDVTVGRG